MDFIWAGDRTEQNSRRVFVLKLEKPCDTLKLCAADFYRIFESESETQIFVAFEEYLVDGNGISAVRAATISLR